jgi:two-component system, NarL family, response regulator YdfI
MTVIRSAGKVVAGDGQDHRCRILLVDGHRLFREALGTLLAREREFSVVGEAADGAEALELITALQPNVVITDLHAGLGSSVRHLEELHARFPEVAVLVLTAFRAHDVAARVRRAGALGYLLKERGLKELLTALREVAAGRGYRSDESGVARPRVLPEQGTCAGIVDLTERQRQVLRSLALGYRTRETARMLGVSVKAVHKQRERIREALRLESVAALTRFAAREGFAEEDAAAN